MRNFPVANAIYLGPILRNHTTGYLSQWNWIYAIISSSSSGITSARFRVWVGLHYAADI